MSNTVNGCIIVQRSALIDGEKVNEIKGLALLGGSKKSGRRGLGTGGGAHVRNSREPERTIVSKTLPVRAIKLQIMAQKMEKTTTTLENPGKWLPEQGSNLRPLD
jgi:hypothetical protein